MPPHSPSCTASANLVRAATGPCPIGDWRSANPAICAVVIGALAQPADMCSMLSKQVERWLPANGASAMDGGDSGRSRGVGKLLRTALPAASTLASHAPHAQARRPPRSEGAALTPREAMRQAVLLPVSRLRS
jgi:hypothetical protein